MLPESIAELIECFTNSADPKAHTRSFNVKLWRGQADIRWPIDSGGFRRNQLRNKYNPDEESALRSYERNLLDHATHGGFRYQDGRQLTDFELLARLQHHGAATRLVDVSRSAFVGLWFSANALPDSTGILIGVHTDKVGGMETDNITDSYDERMKSIEHVGHPQVYEPPVVSARIAAQHAQFLYSRVSDRKTGSLCLPEDRDSTTFIAVTPLMKEKAMNYLETVCDITTKTLFPDLDGFGLANSTAIPPAKMNRW